MKNFVLKAAVVATVSRKSFIDLVKVVFSSEVISKLLSTEEYFEISPTLFGIKPEPGEYIEPYKINFIMHVGIPAAMVGFTALLTKLDRSSLVPSEYELNKEDFSIVNFGVAMALVGGGVLVKNILEGDFE